MTGRTLLQTSRPPVPYDARTVLRGLDCSVVRQKGSHVRVQCGRCVTTVPVHQGEDLKIGTLHHIERDLEPCLGKGWLHRKR